MKNRKQNFDAAQIRSIKYVAFIMLILPVILSCTNVSAQIITKAMAYSAQQRNMIVFTVAREANVRCYNIEAANDTVNFEQIAKVKSLGNTVMPREYKYDITGSRYKYYRITGVYMNWQYEHSTIISMEENKKNAPGIEHTPVTSQAIVKNMH